MCATFDILNRSIPSNIENIFGSLSQIVLKISRVLYTQPRGHQRSPYPSHIYGSWDYLQGRKPEWSTLQTDCFVWSLKALPDAFRNTTQALAYVCGWRAPTISELARARWSWHATWAPRQPHGSRSVQSQYERRTDRQIRRGWVNPNALLFVLDTEIIQQTGKVGQRPLLEITDIYGRQHLRWGSSTQANIKGAA
jgi:hypothetical protein